jgi:hypothetical protein
MRALLCLPDVATYCARRFDEEPSPWAALYSMRWTTRLDKPCLSRALQRLDSGAPNFYPQRRENSSSLAIIGYGILCFDGGQLSGGALERGSRI